MIYTDNATVNLKLTPQGSETLHLWDTRIDGVLLPRLWSATFYPRVWKGTLYARTYRGVLLPRRWRGVIGSRVWKGSAKRRWKGAASRF